MAKFLEVSEIEQKILDFAKSNSSALAVSRGNDPEEGYRVYYVFTKVWDHGFADKVSKLDLKISRLTKGKLKGRYFEVGEWPYDDIESVGQGFLGELLWDRSGNKQLKNLR